MTAHTCYQLAVFGQPVHNSLSPAIHHRFARAMGLNVEYQAIECPAGELAGQLETFRKRGGTGCNVTLPLKHEALDCAVAVAACASAAGAANTLVWENTGWHAFNTDGAGLVADLKRNHCALSDHRILIVGAGGAVAGILPALIEHQPAGLDLSNRNRDKADRLRDHWRNRFDLGVIDATTSVAAYDLIIQATSLGHRGLVPKLSDHWLHEETILYDLNYGPAHQPLQHWAEQRGVASIDGLGMLVEQAASAFARFTGCRPESQPVLDWLQARLNSRP